MLFDAEQQNMQIKLTIYHPIHLFIMYPQFNHIFLQQNSVTL